MSTESNDSSHSSINGDIVTTVTPSSTMSFGYLQSGKLEEDLLFLVSEYRDTDRDKKERDILARSAIILMAFHFECLSNSLYYQDETWKGMTKNRSHYSQATRKFIAKAIQHSSDPLTVDYSGIQDLFRIRNNVFAHSPEQTVITSNDPGKSTRLVYLKFTDFPHSLKDLGVEHADKLLDEVTTFLAAYTHSMKVSLPDWWVRQYAPEPY